MTALAMLPAGMVAARQPAPPAALMIAFDCVDQWPLYEPLITVDFGLVSYRAKTAEATPGAYAAEPFFRPPVSDASITADFGADLYAVEPYVRPPVSGAVITADFGAALYAFEPYVRPPVPGAVITADFGANLYGAA